MGQAPLGWALICSLVWVQVSAQPVEISFDQVSVQHGLSQVTVFDIYQDRRGFMWFGTQDGLNRYDGKTFVVFKNDPNQSGSLSDNYIWSILEDRAGSLWIGTNGGGLNRFDGLSNTVRRFRHRQGDPLGLSSDKIYALAEDHDGRIWIGANGGGLNVYDPGLDRFQIHRAGTGAGKLNDDNIWSLLIDEHNTPWVGTSKGLSYYDRTKHSFHRVLPDELDDAVFAILRDTDGPSERLWLGTDKGLLLLDGDKDRPQYYHFQDPEINAVGANWVRALLMDPDGMLWVGTLEGVVLLNPETGVWRRFANDPADSKSLSNNGIYDLHLDHSGSVWVGTAGGGLNKFSASSRKFANYRAVRDGLSSDIILAVAEDRVGDLWIGSWPGGVNRRDRETGAVTIYQHNPEDRSSLSSNLVRSLYRDLAGRMWVGCDDGVLHRFNEDTESFKRFQIAAVESDAIGPNVVYDIMEDGAKRFWVATGSSGLVEMDPSGAVLQHYRHDPSDSRTLGGNSVYTVVESHDGMLWLGMDGAGINRLDPDSGRVTRFPHQPNNSRTPAGNRSRVIYESRDRALWIGTDNGLNRYNQISGHFEIFTEADGLPNQVIYGILEDEAAYLWLSTNKGLSKFNPVGKTFRNYDMLDGLPGNEFNTGAWYRGGDGRFYFGGVSGLVHFRPDEVIDNTWIPPVVITDISVFGESIDNLLGAPCYEINELELSHRQNFFTFTFAALDFVNPSRNQYAYMMEGLDREWIQVGNRRFAGYTNIDPGKYVFKVRATNHDGVWNPQARSLHITVTPPFWMRAWFRLLLLVSVIGLMLLVHLLRLRAVSAKNRRLEEEVQERTASLAKMNLEIADTNHELTHTVAQLQTEIQERLRAEQALLLAKDAAEAATRVKSDFLATMSHEIRTPMNGVIGMTQLLKGTPLTDVQKDYVRTIDASGETLLTLINDILDFSKIEAGKLTLENRSFQPADLLEDCVMVVAGPALEKGLEINIHCARGLPGFVSGDQSRIKQILVNLLGNAVKFTKTGEILLAMDLADRQPDPAKGAVALHVTVADTGIGIPVDKQDAIFSAFSQADASTTRQFGGTGLGLAICRELVAAMDGRIWVNSQPGRGACFEFEIQLEISSGDSSPFDQYNTPGLAGKHLFIAVRNIHLRAYLADYCTRWGMNIQAPEGPHWLGIIAECSPRPDLFILDEALEGDPAFDALEDAVHNLGPVIRMRDLGAEESGRPDADNLVLGKPPGRRGLFHLLEKAMGLTAPENPRPSMAKTDVKPGQIRPLRILVAEDNRVNQMVIKGLLGRLGYEADYAENGVETLEALESNVFDLVLMDVQMPIMDGIEATRRIKSRYQNGPKIVGLTANARVQDREQCLAAGMDGYLSKPVKLEVLVEEMWRVTEPKGS